jgi:glycosyltransferase involved in cell wall biosynthesis
MKVLVIDEWLPWPLESGKKIRSFNLISQLAGRHEILYLAYVDLPKEMDKVKAMEDRGIRVIPVVDERTKKWTLPFYLSVVWNFASKKPFSTAYHIKKCFANKLREVLECEKPDLVHCEWTNLAPFLECVRDIPRVISAHNVESDIWRRLGENAANPLIRFLGWHQAKKIERLERDWYPKVDHCIAVSDEDRNVIESYGAKVSVVENGVDIQFYDVSPLEIDENRLTYVSSLDTFSNQDAVDFFVKEIFPLTKRSHPEINLWIVGKDPPKRIKEYSIKDPTIHVTGTVPDVREYLLRSAICVVPLRIGGGSRLKILEAMAMKKPVVSTSVGAEGLKVEHGENILIADNPGDFSSKVSKLLLDKDMAKSIGEAGWKLVRLQYDWKVLAEKQNQVWENLGMSKLGR